MSHSGQPNYASLVKMANQISQFFESESGLDKAPTGIAEHIRKFWDPRMRTQILAHLASGGDGLRPAAAQAVKLLEPR